jgi:hypothetical protein
LNTHGADAVVLSASGPIAASYSGSSQLPSSQPTTDVSFPELGPARRVALYNPSSGAAHVALSIAGNGKPQQKAATVPPSELVTVRVRAAGDRPAAVHVTSDVPVVPAPSR